jgi:phage shock protein A
MGIFSRIFKVGQAEANSLVNKLEDPIKMTEQGIRDLKEDLKKAMESLAQVKSLAIAMERDEVRYTKEAEEWEKKAMLLLSRVQGGQLSAEEGERLAKEALLKKETAISSAAESRTNGIKQNEMVGKLSTQIDALKRKITDYETDLKTLKARAKTAEATKKINKQLSNIDSGSTLSMLERMKERVDEEEALAQAYGDVSNIGAGLESDIDKALAGTSTKGDDLLAELKAKMNK